MTKKNPATADEIEAVTEYLAGLKPEVDATPEALAHETGWDAQRAEDVLDELSLNVERWQGICDTAEKRRALRQAGGGAAPEKRKFPKGRRQRLGKDEQAILELAVVAGIVRSVGSRVGWEKSVPTSAVLRWLRNDDDAKAVGVRGMWWWASSNPHQQNDLVQQSVRRGIANGLLFGDAVTVNGRARTWYMPTQNGRDAIGGD